MKSNIVITIAAVALTAGAYHMWVIPSAKESARKEREAELKDEATKAGRAFRDSVRKAFDPTPEEKAESERGQKERELQRAAERDLATKRAARRRTLESLWFEIPEQRVLEVLDPLVTGGAGEDFRRTLLKQSISDAWDATLNGDESLATLAIALKANLESQKGVSIGERLAAALAGSSKGGNDLPGLIHVLSAEDMKRAEAMAQRRSEEARRSAAREHRLAEIEGKRRRIADLSKDIADYEAALAAWPELRRGKTKVLKAEVGPDDTRFGVELLLYRSDGDFLGVKENWIHYVTRWEFLGKRQFAAKAAGAEFYVYGSAAMHSDGGKVEVEGTYTRERDNKQFADIIDPGSTSWKHGLMKFSDQAVTMVDIKAGFSRRTEPRGFINTESFDEVFTKVSIQELPTLDKKEEEALAASWSKDVDSRRIEFGKRREEIVRLNAEIRGLEGEAK